MKAVQNLSTHRKMSNKLNCPGRLCVQVTDTEHHGICIIFLDLSSIPASRLQYNV